MIGLTLGPHIEGYVLTDQDYVMKLLHQNLSENQHKPPSSSLKNRKSAAKPKGGGAAPSRSIPISSNVIAKTLDWEADQVTVSLTGSGERHDFDVVLACDCIYNDALIEPLVQTCIDACKLRAADRSEKTDQSTLCVVAQQLRSHEVFEGWLRAFHDAFRVWRLPDEMLTEELGSNTGFVVHVGVLR